MNIVNEIKKDNKPLLIDLFLSSYLISQRISPYISNMYIKNKVIPNKITLHMILSGIIGAVMFALPNIYFKVLGAVFIQLWFVLDCSDGEVARCTQTFSRYGKELDYIAHLINHPLFGISLFISLMQLGRYNIFHLMILVFASNFLDYAVRNLLTLNTVFELKKETSNKIIKESKWTRRKIRLFITRIFTLYTNLILFGVIIYFVDYFIGTNILYWYLLCNVLLTTVDVVKDMIQMTKAFYFS